MDLKTLLRKIVLKRQFIQILEKELSEIERLGRPAEETDPDRPAAD